MGSKNKLKRFKENETFSNVIQPLREDVLNNTLMLKGNWNRKFFKNENPIVLELGCGKGEYSVNLATMFPEKNFLGIDIKGARFWRGAKTALAEKINNDEIPRLFERFYRVDKSGSREQGGSGLGLSIVKHILDAQNEKIYVESQIGIGSEFSFTLEKAE